MPCPASRRRPCPPPTTFWTAPPGPASGVYTIVAVDRVRRLDDEGEATFPLLEGCFLVNRLDHVEVVVVSVPGGMFIIVATPTV